MKTRVLVLNSDSLAALSVSDERISHGFKVNHATNTIEDFYQSSKFNTLLNLPSCLSKHINFHNDTKLLDELENSDQELLSNCQFYTIDDEANLDCSYVKKNFDLVLFFLHDNLDSNTRFNEALIALLTDSVSLQFIIFNLQITHDTWLSYQSESRSYLYRSMHYFLTKVLPKAKLVTLSNSHIGNYILKEQYLKFYQEQNLATPNFYETVNGYSLFNLDKVEQSLKLSNCLIKAPKAFNPKKIVLSSSLFTHHLVFGMSPYGAKLLRTVHDCFANASLMILLDKSFYSYLNLFKDHKIITKKASIQDLSYNNEDNGINLSDCKCSVPYELHDNLVAVLNELVTNLIKFELFKEQDNLPPFPALLDGSYYGSELNDSLKEYEHIISKCFISVDYSDFDKLNADLVICDNAYVQRLALANGVACLTLNNDLNGEAIVSCEDFAIFEASRLDFLDLLLPRSLNLYHSLKDQGLMNYYPKVGQYGSSNNYALLESDFSYNLSLSKVISSGLLNELLSHQVESKNDKLIVGNNLKDHWLSFINKFILNLPQAKNSFGDEIQSNKVAQFSNYTNSQRYQLQWQFLQYLTWFFKHEKELSSLAIEKINSTWELSSIENQLFDEATLKVLSFGCSRGQEMCDLTLLFDGQLITGADINYDVLTAAKQLKANLQLELSHEDNSVTQEYSRVCYLGNHAYWRIVHSSNLLDLNSDNKDKEQFDIVCAMTVLCRHPDTVGVANCSTIYPFADFENLLKIIDSLVKKDGLLCLYNANYRIEDSAFNYKYVKVFPCDNEDFINKMPIKLRSLYQSSSLSDKIGYVNKFAPSGEYLSTKDIGTIFLKVCD